MGSLTTKSFDYASVDKDTKGMLISFAGQFAKQVQYHAASGMEAGKIIDSAHKLFAKEGCEGKFSEWVESELKVSRQTAYNYMWAYQRFGNCKTIYSLDAGAMYKLAAPTVPEAAAKEAIKLTEKGHRVDKAKAKELVDKFKELVKPKPPKAKPATEPPPVEANECAPGKHKWNDEGDCEKCHVSTAVAEPEPADYGKCPNCAGTKWTKDGDGVACAKCHHPHGEPTGGADEDQIGTQRSKTIKTVEALMRAFDDLNLLLARPMHSEAIASCKALLKTAKGWK